MRKGKSKGEFGIPPVKILERDFQDAVIRAAKAHGWKLFYIPDSAKAGAVGRPKGWPDLTLAHPEMFIVIFAECKTDNQKSQVTPEQCEWLTMLSNAGESVQLWRPAMWDHIDKVLAGPSVKTWKALNTPGPWDEWGQA